MKCEKCGHEIKDGEKFCQGCGTKTEFANLTYGKVIIKRKSSFYGCAIPFTVYVDEKPKGNISNGKTLELEVPYGTHKISFNTPKDKANREITLSDDKKIITITVKTNPWAFSMIAKAKIISVE